MLIVVIILLTIFLLSYINFNNEYFNYINIKPKKRFDRDADLLNCIKLKGRDYCDTIFPKTYRFRIGQKNDRKIFLKNHSKRPEDIFVMKKINGSSRRGIKLARYKDIINTNLGLYEHLQVLKENLLLIKNRIFHVRMYLIIDCCRGIYLFKDGIVIYAKDEFDPNNIKWNNVITANLRSGCQNKKFYDEKGLPNTLIELYKYLSQIGIDSQKLEKNIFNVFSKYAKLTNICSKQGAYFSYDKRHTTIDSGGKPVSIITGVDIIIDNDLNPTIVENNFDPDLITYPEDIELEWQNKLKYKLLVSFRNRIYDPYNFHKISSYETGEINTSKSNYPLDWKAGDFVDKLMM